jgi:Tfp pilus assembly protein PilX
MTGSGKDRKMTRKHAGRRRRTRGIALPTALLVLVVLTLLGTAAVLTSGTESDIAGNGRVELSALSAAEAGVHEAIARLNMKTGAAPTRITPGETAPGVPDPAWTVVIDNKNPLGANERQTVSGAAGSSTALPTRTTVTYKLEDGTETPPRCNGTPPGSACNGQVVLFHTNFNYGGSRAPTGSVTGSPVLRIASTYTGPASAKTIVVEAARSIPQAKALGAVRACGPVTCSNAGQGYVDGTLAPGGTGIIQGSAPGANACGAPNVVGAGATPVQTTACPVPASDLFTETFGMPAEDVKPLADIQATAPYGGPPPGTTGKLIWVSGPALSQWNSNMTIGSPTDPVVVVFEGNFLGQGTITVWGVIYVMGNVIGTGNMKINGALVAQGTANVTLTGSGCSGGGSPTTCISRYDPSVLGNISDLSPFTTLVWQVN